MLPVSQIWQISTSVDAEWRSPIADSVAAAWGLPAGAARWLRSSATHVFITPGREGGTPSYLRFARSSSLAGEKLSSSAPLLAAWADRGLGAVRPVPSVNGQLTEMVETPLGDVTAMLVPAAPGAEVSVDHLTTAQARAWGKALANVHREGTAGIFPPCRMPAGQDAHTGHDIAGFDEPLTWAIAAGRGDTEPEWVRGLRSSLLEHQSWHRQRLLGGTSQPTPA